MEVLHRIVLVHGVGESKEAQVYKKVRASYERQRDTRRIHARGLSASSARPPASRCGRAIAACAPDPSRGTSAPSPGGQSAPPRSPAVCAGRWQGAPLSLIIGNGCLTLAAPRLSASLLASVCAFAHSVVLAVRPTPSSLGPAVRVNILKTVSAESTLRVEFRWTVSTQQNRSVQKPNGKLFKFGKYILDHSNISVIYSSSGKIPQDPHEIHHTDNTDPNTGSNSEESPQEEDLIDKLLNSDNLPGKIESNITLLFKINCLQRSLDTMFLNKRDS